MGEKTEKYMKKEVTQSAQGKPLTFGGGLALLFIGLKLCSVIDWGWWLVLLPVWFPPILNHAVSWAESRTKAALETIKKRRDDEFDEF